MEVNVNVKNYFLMTNVSPAVQFSQWYKQIANPNSFQKFQLQCVSKTVHSPLFLGEIVQIYRVLPSRLSWFSNVPRVRASGIIALAGGGGEKNIIFLASCQTAPAP